jgi:hypothetical protein
LTIVACMTAITLARFRMTSTSASDRKRVLQHRCDKRSPIAAADLELSGATSHS